MNKTAIFEIHKELNGKMVNFSNYLMPLQYGSIIKEHEAVRNNVGIFDVSHMGIFEMQGKDTYKCLNYLISNDLNKISNGFAQYSPLLKENGTFVDDIIVYLISKEEAKIVVNCSNKEKDFERIMEVVKAKNYEIKLEHLKEHSLIAIQGKRFEDYVEELLPFYTEKKPFSFVKHQWKGKEINVARTGYTGENGVEVFIESKYAGEFFKECVDKGVIPCGLGARDSLRLEKGYSLYGNEIDETTNALEAGLGWTVSFDKEFVGKKALEEIKAAGIKRKVIGFICEERRTAQKGDVLFSEGNEEIGVVTSGGFSPSLKQSIGLAYVKRSYKEKEVLVEIRGKKVKAKVNKRVFL